MTIPPPAVLQAEIALPKAALQSKWPSPTAPNLVISNSRLGNFGGWMRSRICGKRAHGSFDSLPTANARLEKFFVNVVANLAQPIATDDFTNWRRCTGMLAQAR